MQAFIAAQIARVVILFSPHRIQQILQILMRSRLQAQYSEAQEWRNAVVQISSRCAGQGCLQRSVAVVLMSIFHNRAITWSTGFRLSPFQSHAWVEVAGKPVGEVDIISQFQTVLTVQPKLT